MSDFIWQCIWYLLQYDLAYITLAAFALLVVLWLVRFIMTLKEDQDEDNIHKRKDHRN